MVRAGVVTHPDEWETSGFHEIQNPKQRYAIIDRKRLSELAGEGSAEQFGNAHKSWIEASLKETKPSRRGIWVESVAVGSQGFIDGVKEKLGYRARGRKVEKQESRWMMREEALPYRFGFGHENMVLSAGDYNFSSTIDGFPIR